MSKSILILGAVLAIVLVSASSCAFIPKGKPLYTADGKKSIYRKALFSVYCVSSGLFIHVDGADVNTFEAVSVNIGKDKRYVYNGCDKQPHVDAATFEITEDGILKDKTQVYFQNIASGFQPVVGADIETYRELRYGIGKDKNSVFYFGKPQTHVDYATFEVTGATLDEQLVKDKNHIYQLDWANKQLKVKPNDNRQRR